MKKSLLLLLLILATVLAYAGGEKEGPASASSTSAAGADALAKYKPVPGKDYSMTIAGWIAGPVDNENGEVLKYYKEKTGMKVIGANIDGTKYNDLINLRLASGDIPEVFSLTPYAAYAKYYEQGIVLEFEESLLKALAPHLYDLYMKEAPVAFTVVRLNPKNRNLMSSLPQYKYHAKFIFPYMWRKDWLKNVGIDKIPDNLREMEAALYKFAKDDPDRNGKADTYGISSSGLIALFGAYGYRPDTWTQREGRLVYGPVQPEMKQALATAAKWYKDGVLDPEFITGENKGGRADVTHAFINNRIGLSLHADYWTWCPVLPVGLNFQEFKKSHPNAEEILHFGVPVLANDGKSRNTQRAPLLQGTYWCFSKKLEKEPDRFGKILEFFDWVYGSYENYRIAWYGLEGKHWATQDGMPQPIGKYALDKGEQNKIGAYTTVGSICEPLDWQGRVRANLDPWATKQGFGDPTFTKFGLVNELTIATPSYNQYWTDLDKIQKQTYIEIITGKKPVDAFDAMVKEWRAAGGDTIEKEATAWLKATTAK